MKENRRQSDGRLHGLAERGRPQARRLRRPAARLRGLTSATLRKSGIHAVDGSFCPLPSACWIAGLSCSFQVTVAVTATVQAKSECVLFLVSHRWGAVQGCRLQSCCLCVFVAIFNNKRAARRPRQWQPAAAVRRVAPARSRINHRAAWLQAMAGHIEPHAEEQPETR
jgi:hypothetical protein